MRNSNDRHATKCCGHSLSMAGTAGVTQSGELTMLTGRETLKCQELEVTNEHGTQQGKRTCQACMAESYGVPLALNGATTMVS